VYLADGNQYFNRPGPRVVETLQIITDILRFDRLVGRASGPVPAPQARRAMTAWEVRPRVIITMSHGVDRGFRSSRMPI
jgi:hypothetical protein